MDWYQEQANKLAWHRKLAQHRQAQGGKESEPDDYDRDDVHPLADLGGPDDVYNPKGEICRRISELLGCIQDDGGLFSSQEVVNKLPPLPGLHVEGVGRVSIPLHQQEVDHIAGHCREDNHVWTIPVGKVKMTNKAWEKGIQEICTEAAAMLGLKGIELEPVLSKVTIYGPGSEEVIHCDVEPDDRVAAALVVYLPSEYSGGNLVVWTDQNVTRYEFGQSDKSAEFTAHCVLRAAGSFHVVEKVTNGYLLTMEYALMLPLGQVLCNSKDSRDFICTMLAEAMVGLVDKQAQRATSYFTTSVDFSTHIALLLSEHYDKSTLMLNGAGAFTGLDRHLFQTLSDANARLPPAKQLKFYVAYLDRTDDGYYNFRAAESITWYSIDGGSSSTVSSLKWTWVFNFLNPRRKTLGAMWDTYFSSHQPFAVVGWPVFMDIHNILQLMEHSGENYILSLNLPTLQRQLAYEAELVASTFITAHPVCAEVCAKLCVAVTEAMNVSLATVFLSNYFPYVKNKRELVPYLSEFVTTFSWDDIGSLFEKGIRSVSDRSCVILLLLIASTLESSSSRSGIIKLVITKSSRWVMASATDFPSSGDFYAIVTHVIACQDPDLVLEMDKFFKLVDGFFLDRVVDALLKCFQGWKSLTLRSIFASVVARRRVWLAVQIDEMRKPLLWQIPVPDFLGAETMIIFLQSPNGLLNIGGFDSHFDARAHAQLLQTKIIAPISMRVLGRGADSFVNIVKFGGPFDSGGYNMLNEYEAEMARLTELARANDDTNASATAATTAVASIGTKRSREEDDFT